MNSVLFMHLFSTHLCHKFVTQSYCNFFTRQIQGFRFDWETIMKLQEMLKVSDIRLKLPDISSMKFPGLPSGKIWKRCLSVGAGIVCTTGVAYIYVRAIRGRCTSKADLTGKTVLITGANTGKSENHTVVDRSMFLSEQYDIPSKLSQNINPCKILSLIRQVPVFFPTAWNNFNHNMNRKLHAQ